MNICRETKILERDLNIGVEESDLQTYKILKISLLLDFVVVKEKYIDESRCESIICCETCQYDDLGLGILFSVGDHFSTTFSLIV